MFKFIVVQPTFIRQNILLGRHYPVLKDLRFVGASQDLAVSQASSINKTKI